ncbi:hypothetical protein LOTGIDRAFT_166768 [Lottia gigantea]|uniref:Apple domain-containing protein n=1 Tax=Lottia gigantea TaxID=225164 RepID=V4BDK6_LOTGI|nr:hypothetical protein LOTGIDRAFT_166768 [Lottia gigantea]ESO86764.1 hypothetical protein LOTGIDRAFT_166768 [Lottia gigantea]
MVLLILLLLSILESVDCNLAYNKPIRANSISYTASAKYVDGDETTCDASPLLSDDPQWVVIDLTGRYDVTAFRIKLNTVGAAGGAFDNMTVEIIETNPFLAASTEKPVSRPCPCLSQTAIPDHNTSCLSICTGRFVRIRSLNTLRTGYCEIEIYGTKNTDPVIRYEFTKQVHAVHNTAQYYNVANAQSCAEICAVNPYCMGLQVVSNTTCRIWTSILQDSLDDIGVSYGLTHIITTCD